MEVKFQIRYLDVVIREHIPALPSRIKISIKRAIEERLVVDPVSFGKPLRFSLNGYRRLRVGDYRIIYKIDSQTCIVTIVTIGHRRDVYEN
jgi:mRNA interferase RelE/StbE